MAQTVLITLTIAGYDTGPFDLYSNADAYAAPFETGIPKASLVGGYLSTLVPDAATVIRVKSTSELCPNYVDLTITTTTTTTSTSTTTTSSTTTTTTSTTSTTSTTTTTYCSTVTEGLGCFNWTFTAAEGGAIVQWTDCNGDNQSSVLSGGESGSACLCDGQTPNVLEGSLASISQVGTCP